MLVIKDGETKLVNIKNQDAVTKVIDLIPDLVNKLSKNGKKNQDQTVSDSAAIDAAFPEEQ